MKLLAIDIGSSSVKAAVLTGAGTPRKVIGVPFPTQYDGTRASVDAAEVERALHQAFKQIGDDRREVDAIAITTMAPSWLAMDKAGRAITPVVTHQDRRAIEEAKQIEARVGKRRHLQLAGNRPFPGGISSTTWRWFDRHEKSIMRRADLVGHLSTWFLRRVCNARVADPSNAAFMGAYESITLKGWSEELIEAVGIRRSLLPEVREANVIAGHVTEGAASAFGLLAGTPVLTGCMDGSAAMLAAGAKPGQMLNVSGSTDVLALAIDHPKPHESLLTRPLGVGKRWLAVSTLAAAGSALEWARRTFYAELSPADFHKQLAKVAGRSTDVAFDPHLAGSRVMIDERSGAIAGLRLGSTRDDILAALCDALSTASGERLALMTKQYRKISPTVVTTGGVQSGLSKVLQRDWSTYGRWRFSSLEHATLRGLWQLL